MTDSKIRRTSSADRSASDFHSPSSPPADSERNGPSESRFFMSFRRKDIAETKNAYAESSKTKFDPPFESKQPKGMYFEAGTRVVDDYASNTDWRSRIQKAVAESDQRLRPSKEPAPWPEAPAVRPSVNEDILWEIDEKISDTVPSRAVRPAGKSIETTVEETPRVPTAADISRKRGRTGAYEQWLAERNDKILREAERLEQAVTAKRLLQKRAEAYEKWLAERNARLSKEESCLKERVAARERARRLSEAYEIWLAEREERLEKADEALLQKVAAKRKLMERAGAYEIWMSEREVRLRAEEEALRRRAAAKQKAQKRAEAYDLWAAERESRLRTEEADLLKKTEAKARRRQFAEAHEAWLSEREERLRREDAQLRKDVAARQKARQNAEACEIRIAARQEKIAADEAALFKKIEAVKETVQASVLDASEDAGSVAVLREDVEIRKDVEIAVEEVFSDDAAEPEAEDFESLSAKSEMLPETEAACEFDEEFDHDLQILMKEKQELARLRTVKEGSKDSRNLDDEFVV